MKIKKKRSLMIEGGINEKRRVFCNLTALFWKYYILEPTKKHFDEMLSYFSEQLVMIGTGKHEFYTDIHHSIPYIEQQSGEYYPKTLSEKARNAMNMARLFEKKSEMDLMTEVYNNVSFKHHVIKQLKVCDCGNL